MRDNEERLIKFILARDAVRRLKEQGAAKPWTLDPILQKYRFCNVRREDDKVTKWIADKWRRPLCRNPDLWFWMLLARLINRPESLAFLHYRMKLKDWQWSEAKFIAACRERMEQGEGPLWGGAYIVSTNGVEQDKVTYVAESVLTPAWKARAKIAPQKGDTLAEFSARLHTLNGVQGFMAGQVIADVKHVQMGLATDWETFAVSGPGSRRGMNRIMGREPVGRYNEAQWREDLQGLRNRVNRMVRPIIGGLHAQDLQNCLCEFDKYERVRLGEGTPRSRYPGEK